MAAVEKTAEAASLPSVLSTTLTTVWGDIPTGVPRAILTPVSVSPTLRVSVHDSTFKIFMKCSKNLHRSLMRSILPLLPHL